MCVFNNFMQYHILLNWFGEYNVTKLILCVFKYSIFILNNELRSLVLTISHTFILWNVLNGRNKVVILKVKEYPKIEYLQFQLYTQCI